MYGILYIILFSFLHALCECYCSSAVWAGVYLHLLPGGGSSYYAQKQQTALYFVFYLMEALYWDVFICFFSSFFFPQRGFWRGFFPWTCWPHVLNKSVLCWLIPVIWNVCFCVIWTSCFILLCSPFLQMRIFNFFSRGKWGTLSKVVRQSKSAAHTSLPHSRAESHSSITD